MTVMTQIEDRLAIRELQDRYADAVFRFDAPAYEATWTEDAHWEIAGRTADGVADIMALWKQFMADMEVVIMYATAGAIEVKGEVGTGRWYIIDINRTKDGRELLINSLYDDVYRKDKNGNWRFKSRKLQLIMVSKLERAELPA